jgi:class 3 adenylate cyclase
VKLRPVKLAPALIALGVILLVCLLRWLQPAFLEQSELNTYDMRVRAALKFAPPVATNLGFVYVDDSSIDFLRTNRSLGYRFGLLWPRQVYGRVVEELAAQKAQAIALDVIFGELRPDHPPVQMADGRLMESDDFFALQLHRAANVIIADTKGVSPPALFATNALALGDITTDTNKDSDGVLRRAQAFRIRRVWHPLFRQAQREYGADLNNAKIEPERIVLPLADGQSVEVPLDAAGNFAVADFVGVNLPPGLPPHARPFTDDRVWHMGIVLAAQELKLDLARAEVDLHRGQIVLRGAPGVQRSIPVDRNGYFYIDWSLAPNDPRLTRQVIQDLLQADTWRLEGQTTNLADLWAGKLVVFGSSATGNNMTDRGATPLEPDTLLTGQNWNVANSIITGRFIRRSSMATDLLLIAALGVVSAILTWELRALLAFLLVAVSIAGYGALGASLFVQQRYWLPLVLPIVGAMLTTHLCLVTWRVVFEQAERRRLKSIFSTVVSPKIMNELLKAEKLSLGGARREITVLFADVRGFTEFTDTSQEKAAADAADQQLAGEAAEAHFDQQARETLATVNLYLGLVADTIIRHDATLDKFIGDCVMAFWGAPTPNPQHALSCVRAAMEAQRAIYELNRGRETENRKIEAENRSRLSAGVAPAPLLPVLLLGTGINTGMVTVGMMGSETKAGVRHGNYTVFGREVNLASRLESLSGRGRILISETTYRHVLRGDPALAATCIALPEVNLKGFRLAVKVYEVPWRLPETPAPDESARASGLVGQSRPAAFSPHGQS